MQQGENNSTIHSSENTWCNHSTWFVNGSKNRRAHSFQGQFKYVVSTRHKYSRRVNYWGKGKEKMGKGEEKTKQEGKKGILSFNSTAE